MKSIARYAVPLAIACGAVVFVVSLALLRGANWTIFPALLVAAVLFVVASAGVWLMADSRSAREVQHDVYTAEAELKLRNVLRELREIRQHGTRIKNPQTAQLLEQVCADGEVLVKRIRERNPNALQSTATIMQGHLQNLNVVLDQYVDIQEQPRYFESPQEKLQQGEAAVAAFSEFLVKSIRLVERGDTVGYDVALKMLEATKYTAIT